MEPEAPVPAKRSEPPQSDDNETPATVDLTVKPDPPPTPPAVQLVVVQSDPEPTPEIADLPQEPVDLAPPEPERATPTPRRRRGAVVGPAGGPMRELFPPIAEESPIETPPPSTQPPLVEPTYSEPLTGDMFWTGRLQKNEVIEITGMTASLGTIGGRAMPGKRVEVRGFSPNVEIIRQPSAADGWSRVAFRALRNTKSSVTVNLRWYRTE